MMRPVDVMKLQQAHKVVQEGIGLSVETFQGHPALLCKALVIMSWRYFAIHAVEEGMAVLQNIQPAYFREVMPVQMKVDPLFERLAAKVATELVEASVVIPEYTAEKFFQGGAAA